MLANLVQSVPLTSESVATLAQSLTGSVLLYNVNEQPQESMTPWIWTLDPAGGENCTAAFSRLGCLQMVEIHPARWHRITYYDMWRRMVLTHL